MIRDGSSRIVIVDARWTPKVNMLGVICECGRGFEHRADRWKMRCPKCGATEHLARSRDSYRDWNSR